MSEPIRINIHGTFSKTLKRNAYSGSSIFILDVSDILKVKEQCSDLGKSIICFGNIPDYKQYTPLYIEGVVTKNERGVAVNCTNILEETWDLLSAANYIEHLCSGIGEKTSMEIAKMCNGDIFGYVKTHSVNDLSEEAGIPIEKAAILFDNIKNTGMQREIFNLLHPHGGTWSIANKIANKYNVAALDELHTNPYAVGFECGLSFDLVDRFAKSIGVNATDSKRLSHILNYALLKGEQSGHTFLYTTELCKLANRIVKKSAYSETIPSALLIDVLEQDDTFVIDYDSCGSEGVYSKRMYDAECDVANHLARLMAGAIPLNYDDKIVEWAEKSCNITYAPEQRKCFELIRKSGVAIVTGGPGTGKTTCINGVISAYEKLNPKAVIKLCAPTGRAAQRMTESTGRESVTIHRLLDYKPFGNEIVHKGASDPIEADLIVVDETSMLDAELASIFLSAVPSGALVLFVGDINQLPSVSAGDVLRDMLVSNVIPSVSLVTVYRQGLQSAIVQNANRIKNGVTALLLDDDRALLNPNETYEKDYEFGSFGCERETLKNVALNYTLKLYDCENPFNTQILCPTHKGDTGVASLNKAMQELVNPKSRYSKELNYGSKVYRTGDKIVMLSNNYNIGYYNGDIGIIKDIDGNEITVGIGKEEIILGPDEFEDLSLAYAMTIHKSQGSEFPNVIVVLPDEPQSMLKRNLLYTAITRAKKKVIVAGVSGTVYKSIITTDTGLRNSRLSERIVDRILKTVSY